MGRIANAVIREEIRRAVGKKTASLRDGGSERYETLKLTSESIGELDAARAERRAVHVMPHKEGGGIPKAVDLLTSVHPMRTGTSITERPSHAFEIRNVNEQIGFQWVMGDEKYQDRLARQLETFYPDSHIEIDELPHPDLLPLREDWHVAAAHLRLKLRGKKDRYYPIKHIDVEGFENDPYGSITSEMVGERESETITNVATQVIFRPAPADWYKGGILAPSIHDVANDLEENVQEPDATDAMKEIFSAGGPDLHNLTTPKRGKNAKTTAAADAVRSQAGQKGWEINIRIVAVGEDSKAAIQRVDETADMFEGYYDSDTQQGFDCVPLKGEQLLKVLQLAMRREFIDRSVTMGVRTAAGIIHMPNDSINTQNVDWTQTASAGDVPASASRFEAWMNDRIGWDTPLRSVHREDDDWRYAIPRLQPTDEEIEAAEAALRADDRGEDDGEEILH